MFYRAPLHILNPNYHSFYLKCPRKCQKTYNFDIFPSLSQFCTSPSLKFELCIVWCFQLIFSQVIEEKHLGGRLDQSLLYKLFCLPGHSVANMKVQILEKDIPFLRKSSKYSTSSKTSRVTLD